METTRADHDLLALLRKAVDDPAASFREGQEESIAAVLTPPHRALVVQATGWGKSMVYFLTTRVLRDQGKGPTLVISPLLSLMRDQLRAAERLGLKAARYTSDNTEDWPELEEALRHDETDLLLISPERLANDSFLEFAASSSLAKVGLVVIDEAHCISDWGHDFRPDYQRLGELICRLPAGTAVLATTATANTRVVEDILSQIGPSMVTIRGPLARKSLQLQMMSGRGIAERLAWLDDHLNELPGSGIIYTLTVKDAERVARWLKSRGHNVLPYHSQIENTPGGLTRSERENALRNNQVKALVATVALGMGFDKPDLGFVVHYQSPGNLVAYYQQIGRAGRAIPEAITVLFLGNEDADIHKWFIESARPPEKDILAVLSALEADEQSVPSLARRLNLSQGEIDKVLKTLSVTIDSPVVKEGKKWRRTAIPYHYDHEREEALKARRLGERARFEEFARTTKCLMMSVQSELDDPTAQPCGRCANCLGKEVISSKISDTALNAAMRFLNRSETPIASRKMWPTGGLSGYGFSGKIATELKCEEGICASQWGDPGVASWVRQDKPRGSFREDLVDAAVQTLTRASVSDIEWVCAVPSLRSQAMVPDFARRLAEALGVPYLEAVVKVKETGQQKAQRNSFHQASNLDGAFEVREILAGPVLLVDDMVDSGWTFTIIGALLRQAGSGPVRPFALTSTKPRGDKS